MMQFSIISVAKFSLNLSRLAQTNIEWATIDVKDYSR